MYPSDGSRAGSQSDEVFTDRVVQRSRRNFDDVGRCGGIRKPGASKRRDRHDSGSMIAGQPGEERNSIIHHSHHGGVKPLGARMFGPPKNGTGSERGNRNSPRARGNDLVENERDTSARD